MPSGDPDPDDAESRGEAERSPEHEQREGADAEDKAKADRTESDENTDGSDPDEVGDADRAKVDAGVRAAHAAATMYVTHNYGDAHHTERPTTGSVDPDDLRAALRHFVAPPRMSDALRCLIRHRVVVLAGPEGSGRRAAALALLDRIPAGAHEVRAPLVYSPSTSIGRLATQKFALGSRLLLADQVIEQTTVVERRYDLDKLRRELERAESALVLTTTAVDGHDEELLVRWEAATGRAVLDHYLQNVEHGLADEDREKLLAAADALTPGEVRRLIGRLERDGVQAALVGTAEEARRRVTAWFGRATPTDNGGPKVSALLPLVVAGFLPGSTRAQHGVAASLLRVHIDEQARRGPVVRDENRDRLDPSRANWPDLLDLRPSTDPFGEPQVTLASPEDHEAILAELVARYGPELWQAVEVWQRDLPDEPEIQDSSCLALAAGMAAFARIDAAHVRRVVDHWAAGLAGARWTAAYTLHWMARDARTARNALLIADSWCTNATQRRAVTAAWAFTLDLAVPYPNEAIARLWQLSLRGTVVAAWASASLAVHLSHVVASADRGDLPRALRRIEQQVDNVLERRGHDHRVVERALDALTDVLTASTPGGSSSLTLHVLRERPGIVPRLATLWVQAMRSFRQRGRAVDHLRETFKEIEKRPSTGGTHAVAALGEEMRARLDDEQWTWLCHDLPEGRW